MRGIQGSQVFLQADLEQILQSILLTNELAQRSGCGNPAYADGFNSALLAVATAVGLSGARTYRTLNPIGGR